MSSGRNCIRRAKQGTGRAAKARSQSSPLHNRGRGLCLCSRCHHFLKIHDMQLVPKPPADGQASALGCWHASQRYWLAIHDVVSIED